MHEPEYQLATRRIFETIQRADEVLGGLELFISRRAELGMAVDRRHGAFFTWLSTLLPNKSRVRVLYRYTNEVVYLIDAWTLPGFDEGPYS